MRRSITVALIATLGMVSAMVTGAQDSATAEYIDSFRWRSTLENFGGFSGFEIGSNGRDFLIVSDGGVIGQGVIVRGGRDEIIDVSGFVLTPLKTTKGVPTQGITDDAEGLAQHPDGSLFVSFEGLHRIMVYDGLTSSAVWNAHNQVFDTLQNNSGLEALAIDAHGTLFTLPERSGALSRPFPIYRFRDQKWDQPFGIVRRPPFLPVGADFGPDGRFYLLERHLSGIFGFQSRVRRFVVDEFSIGDEEILFESAPGQHDNLEGIAVWRDNDGDIRITMVSDDNYRAFQRTEIVEYRVAE